MKRKLIFLTGLILCAFFHTFAENETFNQAMKLYDEGKYDSTILVIRKYLKAHGKEEQSEQFIPLLVDALCKKGEYGQVHKAYDLFREKFPNSKYLSRVQYFEAFALAKEIQYKRAVEHFSEILNRGDATNLDSAIVRNIDLIMAYGFTLDELERIKEQSDLHKKILESANYYQISRLFSANQFARVNELAEKFRREFNKSRFESSVKEMQDKTKDSLRGSVQIGMLAPLSGDDAEIGKRVIQGEQIAIEAYNGKNPSVKIQPLILDTKGNIVETAKRTWELLTESKTPFILGPVLSHTAIVSAAMLKGKDAVMITPTATDDGIADISENVFQMNVTLAMLSQRLARYAIENMKITEFAIIAPKSTYGALMAASFRNEVKRKGGSIIDEQYFDEGTNDYSEQFYNLRTKLIIQKMQKAAQSKGQSLRYKTKLSRADSTKWADSTLALGGLFIPAEIEDAIMLAPQVAFNRVKAQLLGSSGWHTSRILTDAKQYVVNAIISTTPEPDMTRTEWTEFKQQYRSKYNSDPDRVAALGYDAAMLAIKALSESNGEYRADKLSDILTNVQGYRGLSGFITFSKESRSNSETAIMKITKDGFVRVQ